MGLAIDTVLGYLHNAGTVADSLTAATSADGDSFTVRQYAATSFAKLEAVIVKAGTAGRAVQIKSPTFHDDVRGIEFHTVEDPATFLLPPEVGQPLTSGDNLIVQIDAAAASYATLAMLNYYGDVNGLSARLHSWGDISGIIKSIKPLEVDVTNDATPGTWTDTVITTTEDLLHAGSDYAVLGIITDVAQTVVGIKGQETGNLRVCAPGSTSSLDTSDYFVRMSEMHGTPHIPVFNSLNKGSIYASTADDTASTTPKVQLILAELSQTLSS
jgi:hypothetical protein